MDRTEKEEYIIGCISLLSNQLTQFGDSILPDITFKQWFLLMMISKMDLEEKNINSISEFVGTSRQNVKKMLTSLEKKGYIVSDKSKLDARSLKVTLTDKAYQYFVDNADIAALETNKLFELFSLEEIDNLICNLEKLTHCLALYKDGKENQYE
ncbi:MAG: MarR family winged helix-turn-helix transcriptional regulator [Acutalibacteraceae bacterium]